MWRDFFEINVDTLINGSRHVWQPPFFRDILVSKVANSFALIFNSPFSSKTTVELYITSEDVFPSVLEDLQKVLSNRGASFFQIMLVNPGKNVFSSLSGDKGAKTYHFVAMGKIL
jgi:hypothetical protein